ncbi:ROK family transcriptional regulator [Actinoplanes sp. SE50]|uniref:ROK family transcriptional regulator n=1 Tax=unclassified Actinoplanes TaxID=2626549 RepID=UPI00023EBC9B|nr:MULTISPECIES: ROK family transcriptional regulator [unclassified Actinoplanes]AEV81758.1 Xylose repressor [Actinoplanes sp. SE50/110]ATO80159.1 ROK family transcriptional regulator [Actinoplanes sp. SE50]SLL97563.1 transcriptional regulator, ROK family [Actinoplanes sp. SE50/110]
MRAGPSQEEVRRHNLGTLLRYVHMHGATSRAELTTRLGLNRSTIGALTAELISAGLVSEAVPKETGRAGRPSLVVRPESDTVFAYSLSIEVDRLRAARVGLGGQILEQYETVRPPGMSADEAVEPLARFVRAMHDQVSDDARCVGSGLAVAGMVRREDGMVRLAPTIGWVEEPVGAALRSELGAPGRLSIGNHADVCALAEHARGAAVGCDNVIYLYGDVGVGAGIVAGGRRVTGHGGYGGEVGHMVVNPYGRPCDCGSRGCWETEIGEHALLRLSGRADRTGRDVVLEVVDAAVRGDSQAQHALRHVGDWIGFGVGNLVNIFNPEVVIFGGTLRDVYLVAAAQIRSRLNSVGLPACREHVRLRTPELGADAALIGAAELAFEHLLDDPLIS